MSEAITREDAEFLSLSDRALLVQSGVTYINEIADTLLEAASEDGVTIENDADFKELAANMYMSASVTLLHSMAIDQEDGKMLGELLLQDSDDLEVHPLMLSYLEDMQ